MFTVRVPLTTVFSLLFLLAAPPASATGTDNMIVYSARYYRFRGPGNPSHFHLYTIRPDGTGRRQLTFGKSDDTYPECMPDGRNVRFRRLFANQNDAIQWCLLDATTGKITPTAAPKPGQLAVTVDLEKKITDDIGAPCTVMRWDADRVCALVYTGMVFQKSEGGNVPTGLKALRLYDNTGKQTKVIPLSFPSEEQCWLKTQERPLSHITQLTPLPGDPHCFLIGAFYHRGMKGLEFKVDTRNGSVRFWSTSDAPLFSSDGRWYFTGSADHPQFAVIGRRADGNEITEYVEEIRTARTNKPNTFHTIVGGNVAVYGTSWCPPLR